MNNPILREVRRVTGWHTLIDHELFPLLLAAITSTSVLWFYPGIGRIAAGYFPLQAQPAMVMMAEPQLQVTVSDVTATEDSVAVPI